MTGHQTFSESLNSDLYDIKAKLIKQFLLAFICGNQSCTALNSSATTGKVWHLQAMLHSCAPRPTMALALAANDACRRKCAKSPSHLHYTSHRHHLISQLRHASCMMVSNQFFDDDRFGISIMCRPVLMVYRFLVVLLSFFLNSVACVSSLIAP